MTQVVLQDYAPAWRAQFLHVAREIEAALAPRAVCLEHVGSTAVPGLCAKPVLDVLLGADSLSHIEAAIEALAACGFVYRPAYEAALPDRRYFVRSAGALPRVHVHGVVRGGVLWVSHLRLRDRLRDDLHAREAYASLKRQLAARHADDKAAYTAAKAPFIQALLAGSDSAG